MGDRCPKGGKHVWRKTGAVYDKVHGLRPTKRRCIKCETVQDLQKDRPTQDELEEDRDFISGR